MKLIKTKLMREELVLEETLFHVANGYLGVRGNLEEGVPADVASVRGCYINGYYDNVPLRYPEKLYGFPEVAQRMVNLPDVQTTQLWIGGEEFSPFTGELPEYERMLDTRLGLTRRRMRWRSPMGREAIVTITRMASFVRPELFFTLYEVEGRPGTSLELRSTVNCAVSNFIDPTDPRVASEEQQHIFFDGAEVHGHAGVARCHTGASGIAMAVCQRHRILGEGNVKVETAAAGLLTTLKASLPVDGRLTVEKYTLLSDARRQPNPAAHALKAAHACSDVGGAALLREQKEYLDVFWQTAHVKIEGDDALAQGMEFNLFELLQSAGRDSISNVPAKGLSGEGYEGHYFWDTEIYILPFFLLTQPDLARKLLDFRFSVLNAARHHARLLGHTKGALYPWRTIAGSECSSYFPAGSAQYHITGDVAHSFLQYYYATGDIDYMAEKGAEVLLETARLWMNAGSYDRNGRFVICDVTGPDEYTCIVNNNYYTNQCARHNLQGAVEVYEQLRQSGRHTAVAEKVKLQESELAAFSDAAEKMLLPYDERLGICAQDDSFLDKPVWDFANTPKGNYPLLLHYHPLLLYRHQVCKQADTVLAHYLFEEGVEEEVLRNGYRYYEAITTHDSSLSTCVFSIMAARLGMPEKAYEYYASTVRTDLENAHGNTKDGIHTANMGGAYLALVAGFAGLRLRADGLHFRFSLPRQWQGYRFCVWYRGSLLCVHARRKGVEICLLQGEPVKIYVGEEAIEVADTTTWRGAVE